MKFQKSIPRIASLVLVCLVAAGCGGGGGGSDGPAGSAASNSALGDGDPGVPASKASWSVGIQDFQGSGDPATEFSYDAQSYFVREETVHGTRVTVAIHNGTPAGGGPAAAEFADACIGFFRAAWEVHRGFQYDAYVIKVRAPGDAQGFALSPAGVIIDASDYYGPGIREFVAHEMFHSWNGKIFEPEPDRSGNLFQTESWLVEGGTVYYSFRVLGQILGRSEFSNGMANRWSQYEARRASAVDLSFSELAALATGAESGENTHTIMLFARGAILAYLLDERLRAAGSTLDLLMQSLYVNYGLAGRTWTEADLEAEVRSLGGAVVADWLANAVSTNSALDETFDGNFTLF